MSYLLVINDFILLLLTTYNVSSTVLSFLNIQKDSINFDGIDFSLKTKTFNLVFASS